jgi:GT2 family glycosyltransferase
MDCLKSLYLKTQRVSFEVFVVDNCSHKGDLDEVKLAFPQVNFIFLDKNFGFAKSNNVAMNLARGKFVALLNPDTYLLNDAFDVMLDHMRDHPEVGAVGPKLLTPDGGIQFDAARNLPTLTTEFFQQFFLYRLFPRSRLCGAYYMGWWDHQDARNVGALCGACVVVRAEVIRKVGALDDSFFMYMEDVDWCYRIRHGGWRLTYLPEAEVKHLGGHSLAQNLAASRLAAHKGYVHFFAKHYGFAAATLERVLVLCGSSLRLLLWLALSLDKRHRREARDRVLCYWQTVSWILGSPDSRLTEASPRKPSVCHVGAPSPIMSTPGARVEHTRASQQGTSAP